MPSKKGETLVVSSSTSGVEAGQTVTVTFGGKITPPLEANGSWTVNVPPADLAALPDGAGNVQASVSNINGNSARPIARTASMPPRRLDHQHHRQRRYSQRE